jgi:hypothetical protein
MVLETIFGYLIGGLIIAIGGVRYTKLFTKHDALVVSASIVGIFTLAILCYFVINPIPLDNLICEISNPVGTRTAEGGSTSC